MQPCEHRPRVAGRHPGPGPTRSRQPRRRPGRRPRDRVAGARPRAPLGRGDASTATPSWSGAAAAGWAHRRDQLLPAPSAVAAAYRAAAAALRSHAATLTWARGRALTAIRLWDGDPTSCSPVDTRALALAVLADARAGAAASARALAQALDRLGDGLPDGQFHADDFFVGLWDWASRFGIVAARERPDAVRRRPGGVLASPVRPGVGVIALASAFADEPGRHRQRARRHPRAGRRPGSLVGAAGAGRRADGGHGRSRGARRPSRERRRPYGGDRRAPATRHPGARDRAVALRPTEHHRELGEALDVGQALPGSRRGLRRDDHGRLRDARLRVLPARWRRELPDQDRPGAGRSGSSTRRAHVRCLRPVGAHDHASSNPRVPPTGIARMGCSCHDLRVPGLWLSRPRGAPEAGSYEICPCCGFEFDETDDD